MHCHTNDLKNRDLVVDGFPINRIITDAAQIFSEIDDVDSFFALPSDEQFGITHTPISTINRTRPANSWDIFLAEA